MKTKILKINQIDEAVDLLKNGELVALPTETVYGLAADARNEIAIQKIFDAKGRPQDHPLILHIDSYKKLDDWTQNVSTYAQKLAEHFWPGPLTIVLNKNNNVGDIITGGLKTIAIRVPGHPIILEVIKKLGNGIVAPSANAHKRISPTKSMHVLKTLDGKISAILEGGMSSIGIESTIIDMTKDVPSILRYGAITKEMLEEVMQLEIKCPINHNEKVSGNMKNHYQPERPLFLISTDQIESLSSKEGYSAIMHYSNISKKDGFAYYQMSQDKEQYAKHLYSVLHDIDSIGVDKIFVEKPPELVEWRDVNDRLLKASVKSYYIKPIYSSSP
ncbi:MAG: threonylcarbamoyl-AMP synthase [Rickettsiaceae bacterium]|jgi:L-threonylcarbamoyladenylate synthase|nr:threonylcarbamoyl-AMP synthase [Rickettsiaceae bacterium]